GALELCETTDPRGEYVLILEGSREDDTDQENFSDLTVQEHVKMYEDQGMSRKDAMKAAAKDRGVRKSDIYKELL
ncbi:MAG: 16S rRNA (cytidine(1402)-2'-O)-methyltransferase, partial [Lachnospiraceae bacterium]|nr:16S rRNA (cytidine(1402)-2'-O)-methyltransferase [Lachnospiraceae bacterium]